MTLIPEYRDAYLNQIGEDVKPVELAEHIEFFSYHDPHTADFSDDPIPRRYIAYKETPKGYWIVPDYDFYGNQANTRSKKWLRKQYETDRTPRKLFAYRSQEDALYSYYRKKLEHLRHLERKHTQLKRIVRKIEENNSFFGNVRPIVTPFHDFIRRRSKPLEPLKRKRFKDDFLDEQEFAL